MKLTVPAQHYQNMCGYWKKVKKVPTFQWKMITLKMIWRGPLPHPYHMVYTSLFVHMRLRTEQITEWSVSLLKYDVSKQKKCVRVAHWSFTFRCHTKSKWTYWLVCVCFFKTVKSRLACPSLIFTDFNLHLQLEMFTSFNL